MELDRIMQLLKAKTEVKLLRFVSERGPHCCSACLAHDGKVFQADDPDLPELPIHPNCRCKLVEQDSCEQVSRPTEVYLLAENQSKGKQFVRNIPEATQTTLEMKYMPTGTSEMIGAVKKVLSVPLIIGGGINTPETAAAARMAGADIIITGTFVEKCQDEDALRKVIAAAKGI